MVYLVVRIIVAIQNSNHYRSNQSSLLKAVFQTISSEKLFKNKQIIMKVPFPKENAANQKFKLR